MDLSSIRRRGRQRTDGGNGSAGRDGGAGRNGMDGMVSAEYAVGTVAVCTLAGACLYPVLTSPWMRALLGAFFRTLLESWW